MAARPPNDTTVSRSINRYGKRSKADQRLLDTGEINHASPEHNDSGAFGPLRRSNRYVASERRAATNYTGPNRPRRRDMSEVEE